MDRRTGKSTEHADSLSFYTGKVLAAKSTLPNVGEFLKVTGTDADGQRLLGGATISISDISGLDTLSISDISGLDALLATIQASITSSIGGSVILAPTSGTRNTITPTGNFAGLVLQPPISGMTTGNLLEVLDSTGTTQRLQINPNGSLTIGIGDDSPAIHASTNTTTGAIPVISANNYGAGPGVQGNAATAPGGLFTTGGATASSAALVARQTGTNTANLQEWQDAGGTALSSIDYLGRFVGDGSLLTGLPSPLPTFNTETLSATRTLTIGTDANIQYFNPGAANRVVELVKSGAAGSEFTIFNTLAGGTGYYLSVKNGVGGTEIDRIYSSYSSSRKYIYDGTDWRAGQVGSGDATTNYLGVSIGQYSGAIQGTGVAIGKSATTTSDGTAVGTSASSANYCVALGLSAVAGQNATGDSGSVAIGQSANAKKGFSVAIGKSSVANGTQGIAIGIDASAYSWAIAFGANASCNNKAYSTAIGWYARAERYGEHVENVDFSYPPKHSRSWVGFKGATTDATATELFIGGTASNRLVLIASSAFKFTAEVIAYCNGATKGKTWTLQGGIRRDGSNNTTLIGTVVKTVISEDGTTGYDVDLTADDTNESLKVTVTGAASETVRWTVDVKLTECRF